MCYPCLRTTVTHVAVQNRKPGVRPTEQASLAMPGFLDAISVPPKLYCLRKQNRRFGYRDARASQGHAMSQSSPRAVDKRVSASGSRAHRMRWNRPARSQGVTHER